MNDPLFSTRSPPSRSIVKGRFAESLFMEPPSSTRLSKTKVVDAAVFCNTPPEPTFSVSPKKVESPSTVMVCPLISHVVASPDTGETPPCQIAEFVSAPSATAISACALIERAPAIIQPNTHLLLFIFLYFSFFFSLSDPARPEKS